MTTPHDPAAMPQPAEVLVRFAGRVQQFGSYRDASNVWCAFRDESGLGASQMPGVPEIVDPQGKVVGHISYNGRVWPGSPRDWTPGVQPLYDNREVPVAHGPAPTLPPAGPDALTLAARTGYFGNPNPHASGSQLRLAHALGEHLHREGHHVPADVRIGPRPGFLESRGVAFQAIHQGDRIRFDRDVGQLAAEPDVDAPEGPRP